MKLDRQEMGFLWMSVAALLAQAANLLGGDEHKHFLTYRLRSTVRRLVRMAEFLMRRLTVCEALALVKSGELPLQPAEEPSEPVEIHKERRQQNGEETIFLPRYHMRLVEPFYTPGRSCKPASITPNTDHHAIMDPNDGARLRLKISGLQTAMSRRAERARKLALWFATRGEACCIPWRYGYSPFIRHAEHGETIRKAVRLGDEWLNGFIAWQSSHRDPEQLDTS
ncbi:MAG: hypothetical protein CME88_07080 [Hirschia sp.]|nr:hypothetical protein [Hirschia sp.]|tara:strand:- start:3 stop:677 length:675 start_codon:yes stop_codon:yes gene_type:complete